MSIRLWHTCFFLVLLHRQCPIEKNSSLENSHRSEMAGKKKTKNEDFIMSEKYCKFPDLGTDFHLSQAPICLMPKSRKHLVTENTVFFFKLKKLQIMEITVICWGFTSFQQLGSLCGPLLDSKSTGFVTKKWNKPTWSHDHVYDQK